jgi:hypothetical protein
MLPRQSKSSLNGGGEFSGSKISISTPEKVTLLKIPDSTSILGEQWCARRLKGATALQIFRLFETLSGPPQPRSGVCGQGPQVGEKT